MCRLKKTTNSFMKIREVKNTQKIVLGKIRKIYEKLGEKIWNFFGSTHIIINFTDRKAAIIKNTINIHN